MTFIMSIPTGRVSDAFVSRRLLSELQFNEAELLRVQAQVASGRAYEVPSQNPSSALRAIALQRLLEQKGQMQVNIDVGQSYLSASDHTINNVHELLADVRGLAIASTGDTATDEQRAAASEETIRALEEMVAIGNQRFRGRFLFAGSLTQVRPFTHRDQFVQYEGNRRAIRSYEDLDLLFESNLTGDEVFGAISPEVKGTVDLSPRLTDQTRLTELRGGQGITPGSIAISDGTTTSTIDTRLAETVGDLARLIEANPPFGRVITVDVTGTGLTINIDAGGGGNLTVREVGGGHTAAELGILRTGGLGTQPIEGTDVDPLLTLTTPLDSILGVRAQTNLPSPGANNDLILQALSRGPQFNGTTVQFVDDDLLQAAPGLVAGNETVAYTDTALAARASLALSGPDNDLILTAVTPGAAMNDVSIVLDANSNLGNNAAVSYDPMAQVLTLAIDDTNETTLGTLVGVINASGVFTATPDGSAGEGFNAASVVSSADAGVVGRTTAGGADAQTLLIHIDPGNTTANDVIAAIAADPVVSTLFSAQLDDADTFDAPSAGSGAVSLTAGNVLSGGSGGDFDQSSGIQIVNGGATYTLTFEEAETVEDLLNIINGAGAGVLAEINDDGNGIDLQSILSGSDFSIGENGGTTATQLGLRSLTPDTLLAQLNHGLGVHAIDGTDFTIRRTDGVDLDIDVSSAVRVSDVLGLINDHPNNLTPTNRVVAQLSDYGNGITLVQDNPTGPDTLTITRTPGSLAATDLGLMAREVDQVTPSQVATPPSATIRLTAPSPPNTGFVVTAGSPGTSFNGVDVVVTGGQVGNFANVTFDPVGRQLVIDIDPTQTTTNTIVGAVTAEGTFAAALETTVDPTNDGTGIFTETGTLATTAGGAGDMIEGWDPNPLETESVFNSLIRLSEALLSHDVVQIERAVNLLDADMERARFAQAEAGARVRGLDVFRERLADEDVELRKALSLELDTDLVAAISDLATKQVAFQTSLQSMGQILNVSLLDYV